MENYEKRLELLEAAFSALVVMIVNSVPADKADQINRMNNDYLEAVDDLKVYDR